MSWNCVICYEPLLCHHTICAVNCGHVFHEECIEKWISSSKTCPQCRKKCLVNDVIKLFFNQVNIGDDKESAAELLSSLDNLRLQLSENIKTMADQGSKIKKLKDSMKKIKNENESLNAVNTILREKDEMNRTQLSRVECLSSENKALQTKLSTLTKLEKVLLGTSEDVEKLLCSETDLHQMAIFQVTLKRALLEAEHKKHVTYRMYETQKSQLDRAQKSISDMQCNISMLEEEIKLKEDALKDLEKKNLECKPKSNTVSHAATIDQSQILKKRRKSSSDDENIFDNRLLISKAKTSIYAPTSRASSPYHHLSHGSITASLKTANAKIHEISKKPIASTSQGTMTASKFGPLGMKRSLNPGTSIRTHQQPRTSYLTTKLPRKDIRFNFSLSPPRSESYKKKNDIGSSYSSLKAIKSPLKVPKITNKLIKRSAGDPDSSGVQSIKHFML